MHATGLGHRKQAKGALGGERTLVPTHSNDAETKWLLGLALVAVIIQSFPALGEALQWRRSASFPATITTSLTGHLTHWSWDHLLWDLAAFLGLGFVAIRLQPGRFLMCLAIAGFAIPIEIFLWHPQFTTYRGLSGIDSALFGWLLVGLWQQGRLGKSLSALGCAGFVGKSLFELSTGSTLFVEGSNTDFIPATSAHLVGFAGGIIASILKKPNRGLAIPATS